jgi:S1-C subfamily serine protease
MTEQTIAVSAPITTDSAGHGGSQALSSVFRIVCPDTNSSGTGFLHKSGKVLTAEHVSRGSKQVHVRFANGGATRCTIQASDADLDLAILEPSSPILATSLQISNAGSFSIGAQVTTWGFPGGYPGPNPMLSVGYLGSLLGYTLPSGKTIKRWCVNAAFNSGNSGGPLLDVESGTVMGVVSSKLAPISPWASEALKVLGEQESGFIYTGTNQDGSNFEISEGRLIGTILNELRAQVQLVIGMAVSLDDLRAYLGAQGLQP